MKRISIATLATIGLAILACGGGEEEAAGGGGDDGTTATTGTTGATEAPAQAELQAVPVTDPWKSMDLPINNGTPVVSDKTHLLVAYNDGAISTYTTSYGQQIEKNGWTKKDDYSEADFTAVLYEKGGQEMGFAVGNFEGYTVVYFEDLDGVPEEKRVVSKRSSRSSLQRKVQHHRPNKSASKSSGSAGGKKGKGKGKGKKKGGKKGGKKKR